MKIEFFDYPVYPANWDRPAGNRGYRITAHYNSTDLINGGLHRSVDVGNFREGDPVRAPSPCEVMGLQHWDGAKGVRFYAPNGEVWELWHLDTVSVPINRRTRAVARQQVGTTGDSGANVPRHTHIEREVGGNRVDPEPFLLGKDYNWEGDEAVPRLTPVREQWDIPKGAPFWLDGPEQGSQKSFSSAEKRWSNNESVDGVWRLIEYDDEILWMKREDIDPIPGTRNPKTGFGSPTVGITEAQAKKRETTAADVVLEAAKTAAKKYGAS